MSAIGDYVHYSSQGYAKYGIAKSGDIPKKDTYIFTKFKQKFLRDIKAEENKAMSAAERKLLQRKINMILNPNVDRSQTNNMIAQIQNELERFAIEQAQKSGSNALVNFSTGDVSLQRAQAYVLSQKAKILSLIDAESNKMSVTREKIESRIKNIQDLAKLIKNNTDKITVEKQIKDITEQYKNIIADTANLRGTKQLALTQDVKSLAQQIDMLLAAFDGTTVNNIIKGDFFEYLTALTPLVGQQIATDELSETLKKFAATKVGDMRSTVDIDTSYFDKSIDFKALAIDNKGWKYSKDGQIFGTIMPTQEKIDVKLSWQGRTVPTSIKNVNLSSGFDVHVVSNTSLLYLIQDANSDDFINHYLNVVAKHNDSYRFDQYISTALYRQAQSAMKLLVLHRALTGKTGKRQAASIFLVNDNSKSGIDSIKVFDIPELIGKVSQQIETFTTITSNGNDLAAMRLDNPWCSTYSARITTLIQDVHAQKISAALKPSAFML